MSSKTAFPLYLGVSVRGVGVVSSRSSIINVVKLAVLRGLAAAFRIGPGERVEQGMDGHLADHAAF